MTRYGMVINVAHCIGCYNCFIACKDEHCEIDHLPYAAGQPMRGQTWMRVIETERGRYPKVKVDYTAIPCMHCEKPLCVEVAGDGSVYRREDGIVLVDPEKAKGRRDIVSSCPYRVIYWNDEKQLPQKCTLCAHLLDAGWKQPRCAEACPTNAIVFGDLDDPESEVSKLLEAGGVEVLHPEYGLGEKVWYLGLPKNFVAGAVVFGDTDLCGAGVTVTLEGEGVTASTVTDVYGDFEFEGLPKDASYTVRISSPGYQEVAIPVRTNVSVYLGDIVLAKA